jgi:predicted DNA-binding protein
MKRKRPLEETIRVRVGADLKARLDAIATGQDRKLANLVRTVLRRYAESHGDPESAKRVVSDVVSKQTGEPVTKVRRGIDRIARKLSGDDK